MHQNVYRSLAERQPTEESWGWFLIQRTPTRENMITIYDATVETLDMTQARPVGKTVLSVTIGDHTFDLLVSEDELIQALASAGED